MTFDPKRGYPQVVPYLLYRDVGRAVRWVCEVLGFRELWRFSMADGSVGIAEVERDGFIIEIGTRGSPTPAELGHTSAITLVFVDDVDAACERAVTAGGTMVAEPEDKPWGLRQALVADPAGHQWELTQHVRDVPPEEWGAEAFGPMPE